MTKTEAFLKKSPLYSALILESFFNDKRRSLMIKITEYFLLFIPVIIILSLIFKDYGFSSKNITIDIVTGKLIGLICLSLGFYILMHLFEAYFASIYYFEYVANNKYLKNEGYTFSAGRILRYVERDNLLTGLLKSQSIGQRIIKRLGISQEEADALLMKQAEVKNPPIWNIEGIPLIKTSNIVSFIYDNYPDFKNLLTNHGLTRKDLLAVTDWVVYYIETREYDRQWWLPEKLARIPGVATDWSFGHTFLLSQFSRNLLDDREVNSKAISFHNRGRELEQVQAILARSEGANAILIGLPGQEKIEVIWNLCRKILDKTATPNLIGKKPLLFLTNSFTSSINSKDDFEDKLIAVFREALESGDVILIIDNLPKLIIQASQYGLNLFEIIEPFVRSNHDQIIAIADTEYFHSLIETNQSIMSYFEVVMVKPLLLEEIVMIIAHEALLAEKKYELVFTYPAILEIAKSAEYYFADGVSGDKARDLLSEISPWAVANNIDMLNKDDVLKYVSEKTNIPISNISKDEKEKLLNLEKMLMKRVVAQREAIFSVSSALRRSRAGIRNEKRPIGSFLFLGPTGVGKTETAKALAEVFFGEEKMMMRLDMSEYQNKESLARLIGSRESNTQGILSNMIRENPYGVLLLDEFEKTDKDILNLFLQIIDEGYFTDALGKKVLARNIMFIATSNAGADKIFNIVNRGDDLQKFEQEIIAGIIQKDIFKPELINRFDATVLFQPLTKENLIEIAGLMLQKVAKRLAEKGMIFNINKELINFIAEGGYNPSFGARPMNRMIQDTVEAHLADLIIREELTAGKTVTFSVIGKSYSKADLLPDISW